MRIASRELYSILICTALFTTDIGASNDQQNTFTNYNNEELSSNIQNEDVESLFLNILMDNPAGLAPDEQLFPAWSDQIDTTEYIPPLLNNAETYENSAHQPIVYTELVPYTEQTALPSSSAQNAFSDPSTEYSSFYYTINEMTHASPDFKNAHNYEQPSGSKRLSQHIEENPEHLEKSENKKKIVENIASSLHLSSEQEEKMNSIKLKQIQKNISLWNKTRLDNKCKASIGLKPVFNQTKNNEYKEIGDKVHTSKIKAHLMHCKTVFGKKSIQNELWFAMASRSTYMHMKLRDFEAINANPLEYKFIEEFNDYYPGLPYDILRYMYKYGPITTDKNKITTEWRETLGDIYVRAQIESGCAITNEKVIIKTSNEYKSVAAAIRMILALSEVYKDLFNISALFIYDTLKEDTTLNHYIIIKTLHEIVWNNSKKLEVNEQYKIFCIMFSETIQQPYTSRESIVIQLYTEIYNSLVHFYEKAKVCDKISKSEEINTNNKYYLLAGKCIIKPQRYFECTTTVDLTKPVSGNTHIMNEETNKWAISSDIYRHYHVHYVDNTKQQYTRVCMPVYLGPIHTIEQIVEYLRRLYGIENKERICPYKRDNFEFWVYIQEEERNRIVDEFAECDIVFYYIEEGMKENYFTFAEFESFIQPEERTVRIPLFISPLMRSAISMGPFEEKGKIKHTVVDRMQYTWIQSSVYCYKAEYIGIKYSYIHHYYRNLYIRKDNADVPTIDCYIMNRKEMFIGNNTAIVKWYVKVPESEDDYTHCILSDELVNDREKYDRFIDAVKSQEYTPDSVFYGFGLQNKAEEENRLALGSPGCSSKYPISQKDINEYEPSITPIYIICDNSNISAIQFIIIELTRKIELIKNEKNQPEITEELKNQLEKKRKSINRLKSVYRQKINEIQVSDKTSKEDRTTFIPFCAFLVFQNSNAKTKSSLGAHNEIFNALTRRYNED